MPSATIMYHVRDTDDIVVDHDSGGTWRLRFGDNTTAYAVVFMETEALIELADKIAKANPEEWRAE